MAIRSGKILKTKPASFDELVHFLIEHYLKFGSDIDKYAEKRVRNNTQHFYRTLIRQYDIRARIDDHHVMSTITLRRIAQCRPDIVMHMQQNRRFTYTADRYKISCEIPSGFQIQNYAKISPCHELLYIAYVVYLKIDDKIKKSTKSYGDRFERIKNKVHTDYLTEQFTPEARRQAHADAGLYYPETNEFAPDVYTAVRYCIKFLKTQKIKNPLDKINNLQSVPQHRLNKYVYRGFKSGLWDSVEPFQENVDDVDSIQN